MNIEHSITEKLSEHARKSLVHAEKIARTADKNRISPEHLLYSIFLEKGSVGATILANMKLTKPVFEGVIFVNESREEPPTENVPGNDVTISPTLKKIITDAYASAADFGYPYVGTEHFVYAIIDQPTETVAHIIAHAKTDKPPSENKKSSQPQKPQKFHVGGMGADMLAHIGQIMSGNSIAFLGENNDDSASALDQFTTNLTTKSDPALFIGQKKLIERITTILGRHAKNNPMIVGYPGVGKTALVEHIAHLATKDDAPAHLRGKTILMLDLALLVAGTSFRGEFEQRLKDVIAEANEQEDVILFIDEIHTIIGTGNTGGSLDAANILKPALARGTLRLIGATTFDEYKKHIEKDAALARRFQKVVLEEPTIKETKKILLGAKETYEKHHHVQFNEASIDAAAELSARYITERHLPDKAFDLLDETAARLYNTHHDAEGDVALREAENLLRDLADEKAALLHAHKYDAASLVQKQEFDAQKKRDLIHDAMHHMDEDRPVITPADIAETVSLMTNIPSEMILQTPQKTITHAKSILTKNIIGQEHIADHIAETLVRSATGLSSEKRPHGSFLFLGPTGTGKTLTAQILAREVYGGDDALIRVDMSELMEKHHASKLLGAPAGYVGYGEGGTLTEKVRKRPYSVVLFDEIEKAHPDTFNILLQILEDGTLTDGEGKATNFKNTIIILTSNIGSNDKEALGFGAEKVTEKTTKSIAAAKEMLPKELLARLDHVLTFHAFSEKALEHIARRELSDLADRMKKNGTHITRTAPVAKSIAQEAHKKSANARDVRAAIREKVENIIAKEILAKPQKKKIHLTMKKEKIVVGKK